MKKILLGVGALIILSISVLAFMFLYTGSTSELEAVANRFQPGSDWQLESERVEPPRIICLGDNKCPSVSKVWTKTDSVSEADFKNLVPVDLSIQWSEECFKYPQRSTICSGYAENEKNRVDVGLIRRSHSNKTSFSVYVERL